MRAEWLRLSRRWDIWLVTGLVFVGATFLYLSAFRASTMIMGVDNPGSWGPGAGPPAEPWFLEAMLSLRAPYAFPGSLVTILDSAWILLPLGAYAAVVTIGPDFWWGTMRSILVTRRSRVAYLTHRLALIAAVVAACLLAVLAVAPVAQFLLLALAGERFPASPMQADALLGMFGARLIGTLGYMMVAAALTLFVRSLAGGVVLIAAFAAAELAIGAAAASLGLPLVRELTMSGALNSIVEQLRPPPVQLIVDYTAGALVPATHQPAPVAHVLSIETSWVVVLVWLVAATILAFARVETMDVVD
jgi:hypothetical protein